MRIAVLFVGLFLNFAVFAAEVSLPEFICSDVSDASEYAKCVERATVATKQNAASSSRDAFSLSVLWPGVWWLVYYGSGLIIGGYIYRDAKRREWLVLGIRPFWWTVLTVFSPAFGVLVYWAVHYSKFAQSYPEDGTPPPAEPPKP